MQLTVWTYEGPPHIGAMRVATGMVLPRTCGARGVRVGGFCGEGGRTGGDVEGRDASGR